MELKTEGVQFSYFAASYVTCCSKSIGLCFLILSLMTMTVNVFLI
jgi:hypothetical protein